MLAALDARILRHRVDVRDVLEGCLLRAGKFINIHHLLQLFLFFECGVQPLLQNGSSGTVVPCLRVAVAMADVRCRLLAEACHGKDSG